MAAYMSCGSGDSGVTKESVFQKVRTAWGRLWCTAG